MNNNPCVAETEEWEEVAELPPGVDSTTRHKQYLNSDGTYKVVKITAYRGTHCESTCGELRPYKYLGRCKRCQIVMCIDNDICSKPIPGTKERLCADCFEELTEKQQQHWVWERFLGLFKTKEKKATNEHYRQPITIKK